MRKKIFLSIVFALFLTNSSAQTDSLSYKNGFWQDGTKVSKSTVRVLMQNNNEALSKFKNAQIYEVIGYIIGCPSAYVFGYDLGRRARGGQGNNKMFIGGGIGTIVGMYFALSSQENYKHSVKIFNDRGNKDQKLSTVYLGITSNGGIGLTLEF